MAYHLRKNDMALALIWLLAACSSGVNSGGRDAATGNVSDIPTTVPETGGTDRVDTLPGTGGDDAASDVDGSESSRDIAGEANWRAVDSTESADTPLTGVGGATSTGGATGSGGQASNGSAVPTGGAGGLTVTGGRTGVGGRGATGGSGTGGLTSTGGNATGSADASIDTSLDMAAGGATGAIDAGVDIAESGGPAGSVTFASGRATGPLNGISSVRVSAVDIVTSPTCNGSPITSVNPCAANPAVWSPPNALCVSGLIPALPTAATSSDYDKNWGLAVCIDASLNPGGVLGTPWTTMTANFHGSPSTFLYLTLHRHGDPDTSPFDTWYCARSTPGTPVSLFTFNTSCWDQSGATFALSDVPSIDKICLLLPSASQAITARDLCLDSIVFGM